MAKQIAPSASQAPRLPFKPGKIVGKVPRDSVRGDYLTDMERQVLEAAGADPNGPWPDLTETQLGKDLTIQFEEARGRAQVADDEMPVPPDTPPVQMPASVDISELTPEKQRELHDAVQLARVEEAAAHQQQVPETLQTIPGMQEAFKMAAPNHPILVDDLTEAQAAQDTATFDPRVGAAAPEPEAPVAAAVPEPEPPEPELPEPELLGPTDPEQEAAPAKAGSDIPPQTHCPKCNHPLDQAVVEVSQLDKQSFIMATRGGIRFVKEYLIYNNQIQFVLRELTAWESDQALAQLDHEVKAEKIIGQLDYLRMQAAYRLAMSLQSFQRAGGKVTELVEIKTLAVPPGQPTCLPALNDWINSELFIQDHVRRAVGLEFMRFQRLIEMMEARSDDPDFYKGIELLP